MKKSFLLLALLLTMGVSAFAVGPLSIGVKAGYKTSKLSYQKEDIAAGFANSFTLGIFGRVELGGFYIQPEVLWYKTSDVFDLNTTVTNDTIAGIIFPAGGSLDFSLQAMNFQVPILFGYKYELTSSVALRAQAGPTLNFSIPQKTIIHQSAGNSQDVELPNETFDTKSIAFGFQGGLGVDLLSNITLDVNYNFGITKVFGANLINNTEWGQYVNTNNISDVHTHMWMVTVGYKFL
jgi:opacity protein-like surface antigen